MISQTRKIALRRYHILFWIIVLIGFQQFPIIRIGGNFKIYEMLAMYLLFSIKSYKIHTPIVYAAFCLFIVSPILSLLHFYFFESIPGNFFSVYPQALGNLKYNYFVFPLLQLLFMFFCYVTFNSIIGCKYLYINFNKLRKYFIITGTIIAIYSIIAGLTFDIIGYLPSFIQNKSDQHMRSCGMSMEAGFYALYQVWVVLFTYYSKDLFRLVKWRMLLIVNVFSLIFTFSSVLASFFALLILIPFITRSSFRKRIAIIFCISILAFALIGVLSYFGLLDFFLYAMGEKIGNLFSAPDHTFDSGAFRSFTTRIGVEIFKDHPIFGVGVGNSVYYMHVYEDQMGILNWGERLQLGIQPQNLYTYVMAEQGIIGIISIIVLHLYIIKTVWKYRNKDRFGRLWLIGCLFTISTALSIPTTYTLYLWIFHALAIGYYRNRYILKSYIGYET